MMTSDEMALVEGRLLIEFDRTRVEAPYSVRCTLSFNDCSQRWFLEMRKFFANTIRSSLLWVLAFFSFMLVIGRR